LGVNDTIEGAVWVAEKELRQFLGRVPVARLTMTILVPIVLLFILSFRLGGFAPQQVPVAVVDLDGSSYSSDLTAALESNNRLVITRVPTRTDAENMIRKGESFAAVLIPSDFSANMELRRQASVELILDDSNTFFAKEINDLISDSIAATAQKISPQPITTTTSFMYGVGLGLVNFIAPGIVAMTAMFGSAFQAISLVWERYLGTLDRIRATPIGASAVILGKILAGSVMGITQTSVVLLFSHYALGAVVRNVGAVILVVFVVAFIFTGIGLIISSLAKEPREATMINQMMSGTMVLLSGIFYPTQALPEALRAVALLLPLTYATEALRGIMIKGLSLTAPGLLLDLGVLLLCAVISLILSTRLLFRILS
jgi:ABC-2 type transport system permease protein